MSSSGKSVKYKKNAPVPDFSVKNFKLLRKVAKITNEKEMIEYLQEKLLMYDKEREEYTSELSKLLEDYTGAYELQKKYLEVQGNITDRQQQLVQLRNLLQISEKKRFELTRYYDESRLEINEYKRKLQELLELYKETKEYKTQGVIHYMAEPLDEKTVNVPKLRPSLRTEHGIYDYHKHPNYHKHDSRRITKHDIGNPAMSPKIVQSFKDVDDIMHEMGNKRNNSLPKNTLRDIRLHKNDCPERGKCQGTGQAKTCIRSESAGPAPKQRSSLLSKATKSKQLVLSHNYLTDHDHMPIYNYADNSNDPLCHVDSQHLLSWDEVQLKDRIDYLKTSLKDKDIMINTIEVAYKITTREMRNCAEEKRDLQDDNEKLYKKNLVLYKEKIKAFEDELKWRNAYHHLERQMALQAFTRNTKT